MIKIIPLVLAISCGLLASGVNKNSDDVLKKPSSPNHVTSSLESQPSYDATTSNQPSNRGQEIENGNYISCPNYGPFNPNDKNPVQMTFTYRLDSVTGKDFAERVRLFKKGQVVFVSKKANFTYASGTTKDVTFSINIHDYLSEDGLELRLELYFPTRNYIAASYSVTFYPPKPETISNQELKHRKYESRCVGFYADGSNFCELKDSFDFTKFGDYIDNDYYYRLDIGKNKFYFSDTYDLKANSIYLRFYDDEKLFKDFYQRYNNEVKLPLTLRKNKGELSFKFVDMFYVEKKTLNMSDFYHQGYYYSPSFYFPVNSQTKFNSKTIYIDIKGLGLNKINTTLSLKYDINRLVVGLSNNSQYFIQGGVR